MLERYKLRLRDGTVLVVDHDALSSWLVDGRAMVQPVGSERWQSLKAFLAKERVEARSAAWRNPAPETPVPVTPPRPRDDERAFRPVRIPPLPPISEPPSVPVPTDEAPVPSFEPASLLPTPDEEVSITVPVAEEPEAPPPPDLSPPSLAPEPVLAVSEPPSIDVPEEEPAALYAESPPPTTDEEVSITVPVAEELEAPPFPDLASASSAPESPPAADEPPEVWVPSEEAAALYSESFPPAPENAPSVVPLKLLDEEDVTPWRTAPAMRGAPAEPPPSLNPRSLQVLAEETRGPRGRGRQPRSESTQGLPIIGLKPLAHEDEASFRAALQPEIYETYEEGQREERAPLLESSFLGLSPTWDARLKGWFDLLSRGLSLVGRGIDRLTPPARPSPVRPFAEEPAAPRSVARPAADVANAIAGAASRGRALFARFRGVASAWAYRVRGWVERYTRRDPSGPSLSFDDAPGAGTPGAALRKPLMPPPQINELPVLRLKADDSESERVDHDVYEGSASLGVAWLWLKRAALIAGFLAGGIVAAGTWETWVPVAARFGRAIVMEIDRRAHQSAPSRDEERPQPAADALPAGRDQLPHLAPQTIALVMSSSRSGALDPPEVFARAYDATERGMSALTSAETQELGVLRRAVLAALPAADRQRLREYDLLRGRRAPLPTENREVLRSVARGARALPPWARERLQELLGKAIAAAPAVPSGEVPWATATR
jgi:hypothetical protein